MSLEDFKKFTYSNSIVKYPEENSGENRALLFSIKNFTKRGKRVD